MKAVVASLFACALCSACSMLLGLEEAEFDPSFENEASGGSHGGAADESGGSNDGVAGAAGAGGATDE
ncbi:MAG: hypothetical protein M3020_19660 [Myxococcota bacterium]|nr:hypothetical protein [Myxococcota bacterium]